MFSSFMSDESDNCRLCNLQFRLSKSCCCQETWIYENINCSIYLFPKILIFLISIIKPFPWSGSIFYWFLRLSNFSFLHPNWFIKFHPLPLVASFDFDCRFSENICKSDNYNIQFVDFIYHIYFLHVHEDLMMGIFCIHLYPLNMLSNNTP